MRSSTQVKAPVRNSELLRTNVKIARRKWGVLSKVALYSLAEVTNAHSLSVAAGHLQLLDGKWYITNGGLLRLACRRHCQGIKTTLETGLSDPLAGRWIFRAIVYKSPSSKGFVGYG